MRHFLRLHLRELAVLALVGTAVAALEVLNLAVFLPMLDTLVGGTPQSGSGAAIRDATDRVIAMLPVGDPFMAACGLFLGIALFKGGLALAHEYLASRVGGHTLHHYRQLLANRYVAVPLGYLESRQVGNLVYNLTMPPIMLSKLLYTLPRVLIDLLRFAAVLGLLAILQPLATFVLVVLGAVLYVSVGPRLNAWSYRLAKARRDAEEGMSTIATEWIKGVRSIRIAHADAHWVDDYVSQSVKLREAYVRASTLLASPRHVLEFLAFAILLVGMMLAYAFDPGAFKSHIATIGVFALGIVRMLPSVATLARAPMDVRNMLPDIEVLYRLTEGELPQERTGALPYSGIRQAITVTDATVEYADRGTVLKGVSLSIPRGRTMAIVGASGSGKTTLLNTILGVQPLDRGAVFHDGHDIRDFERDSVARHVGYVGQTSMLFKGTVEQNIAFFRSSVSPDRIRQAARDAEIAAFIESQPLAYRTPVGEGGLNLSGGQAQRLAIARALARDPDLLLMDEPTSALDPVSEAALVETLQSASRHRTVVLVTHRLPIVRWVDEIVVMSDGRIVQRGSFSDLAADSGGEFARLLAEQSSQAVEGGTAQQRSGAAGPDVPLV